MTNYEFITHLSIDDLAEFLYQSKEYGCEIVNNCTYDDCSGDCRQCLTEWLKAKHDSINIE